jgi:hypothetical protein
LAEIVSNEMMERRRRRLRRIIALLVFVGATAYFVSGLSYLEADLLESQDLGIAHEMWAWGTDNLPQDQSPVYYYFLNIWSQLNYSSFAFLRLPSAVFGGLAVMLVFLILEMSGGLVAGLLGATAMTLNPFVAYNCRLARMYGLLIFASAAGLYCAYQYLVKQNKIRHLVGFILATVLGIYTHMFFFLFAGSMALLFLIEQLRRWRDLRSWLKLGIAGVCAALLLIPQFLRIINVLHYTAARSGVYGGISHQWIPFLRSMGLEFFLNVYQHPESPLLGLRFLRPDNCLIAITAVVLLGMIAGSWRGIVAGILILVPSELVAWHLTASAPLSPRYLAHLLPPIFVFVGLFLGRLRRVYLWGPAAAVIFAVSFGALNFQFLPKSDWPVAADYIQSIRQPGDAVAAFPGFWKWTFRRYFHDDDILGFNMTTELDRAFVRGGPVIVVQGPGRDYNNPAAYLAKYGTVLNKYESRIRARLFVNRYEAEPMTPPDLSPNPAPTVILGGIIGSGGYPWQLKPEAENPFGKLAPLFKSADLTLTGYVPHGPATGRFLKMLCGNWDGIVRTPNAVVARYMAQAGINAAATLAPEPGVGHPTGILSDAGIKVVPMQGEWATSTPIVFPLKGTPVGILYVAQNVCTDAPRWKSKSDALVPAWDDAVVRAKQALGDKGRLIVLVPHAPNYDRLFPREDQMLARRAIDLGADAVVWEGGLGFAEVEPWRNGVIAYSLGSLLRPPFLGMSMTLSNGILLRLRFPEGGKTQFDVIPVAYDDRFRLNYTRPSYVENLTVRPAAGPAEENLLDRIIDARVTVTGRGATKPMAASRFNPAIRGGATVYEGYTAGGAYVGAAGIDSLGQFRRVLLMNPGANGKVSTTFPKVFLGEEMRLVYGLNDEGVSTRRLGNQKLVVSVGDKVAFNQWVECTVGWHTATVDTSAWAGQEQDVTFVVETSPRADYGIGVEAIVHRGPETVAKMAERPYRFDEHIMEARATVEQPDGQTRLCLGPDETFRNLRHEEDGPYGEGVLYRRWACGVEPWDSAGLTLQQSGKELRKAIWLHPLADAKRRLSYGPLPLRAELQGYLGFTDLSVNGILDKKTGKQVKWNSTPVVFSIYADERLIYQQTAENENGWKSFAAPIPADLVGKTATLSFVTETTNASWRHFCFDAWMQ